MQALTERYARSAVVSATGGAFWIAGGLLGGATGRWQMSAEMLVIAALPLMLATLLGLTAGLQARLGRATPLVRSLAVSGAGLAGVARVVDLTAGTSAVAPLFGVGMLLLSGALIVLGGSALRTAEEAGWEGLLLLVGLIGLFLPVGAGVAGTAGLIGWAIWGAGWICIGNVVWQTRATTQSLAAGRVSSWRDTARSE